MGRAGRAPSYGYRRVWALLRRQSEAERLPVVNAKRVYRVMRDHGLLLEETGGSRWLSRHIKGRVAVNESNRRWCSDGFEFRCDNGENSGSRSPWTAVTGAFDWAASTGVTTVTRLQDVMLRARSSSRWGYVAGLTGGMADR